MDAARSRVAVNVALLGASKYYTFALPPKTTVGQAFAFYSERAGFIRERGRIFIKTDGPISPLLPKATEKNVGLYNIEELCVLFGLDIGKFQLSDEEVAELSSSCGMRGGAYFEKPRLTIMLAYQYGDDQADPIEGMALAGLELPSPELLHTDYVSHVD